VDSRYLAFEGHVTRRERTPGGEWRTTFRARDRGVAGPGYLRVETLPDGGGEPLGRIFDLRGKKYWEYVPGPEGPTGVLMWPLEEKRWLLREEFLRRRREARKLSARLPPLVRPDQWRLFSGSLEDSTMGSAPEVILGQPAVKHRFAALPGFSWIVWLGKVSPLPRRKAEVFLEALGMPPDKARAMLEKTDGMPLAIEMVSADETVRLVYGFTELPRPGSPEGPATILPESERKRIADREERLKKTALLRTLIDRAEAPPEGVTRLGLCVRLGATLDRTTVHSAIKRFAALRDRCARRYLMYRAGKVAPDLAIPALRRLLREGELEVKQD